LDKKGAKILTIESDINFKSEKSEKNEYLLQVKQLKTYFYTEEGIVKAVDGVSFEIKPDEIMGLVGETGCGKSVTALSILKLIRHPGKIIGGEIIFNGEDLVKKTEEDIRHYRGNTITMIFQDPMNSLNPVLKVGDQIAEVFLLHQEDEIREELGLKAIDDWKKEIKQLNKKKKKILRHTSEKESVEDNNSEIETIDKTIEEINKKIEDHKKELKEQNEKRKEELQQLKEKIKKLKKEQQKIKGNHDKRNDQARIKDEIVSLSKKVDALAFFVNPNKKKVSLRKSAEILNKIGIPDSYALLKRYPHELSGGMRQRVMIAMGLACNSKLLICDEPTTALDVTIQAQILQLIKNLKNKFHNSVLFITHDLGVIHELCDKVAVMYAGNIVEYGSVHDIFENPQHPYTVGLLGAIPRVKKGFRHKELSIIPGLVPNLILPLPGCRFHPRCEHAMKICQNKRPQLIEQENGVKVACFLYDKDSKKEFPSYYTKLDAKDKRRFEA